MCHTLPAIAFWLALQSPTRVLLEGTLFCHTSSQVGPLRQVQLGSLQTQPSSTLCGPSSVHIRYHPDSPVALPFLPPSGCPPFLCWTPSVPRGLSLKHKGDPARVSTFYLHNPPNTLQNPWSLGKIMTGGSRVPGTRRWVRKVANGGAHGPWDWGVVRVPPVSLGDLTTQAAGSRPSQMRGREALFWGRDPHRISGWDRRAGMAAAGAGWARPARRWEGSAEEVAGGGPPLPWPSVPRGRGESRAASWRRPFPRPNPGASPVGRASLSPPRERGPGWGWGGVLLLVSCAHRRAMWVSSQAGEAVQTTLTPARRVVISKSKGVNWGRQHLGGRECPTGKV